MVDAAMTAERTPRLPEPNFWLIGFRAGFTTSEEERAEWHDQWHVEHPAEPCDNPDRPRSMHRPGRIERLRRWIR